MNIILSVYKQRNFQGDKIYDTFWFIYQEIIDKYTVKYFNPFLIFLHIFPCVSIDLTSLNLPESIASKTKLQGS